MSYSAAARNTSLWRPEGIDRIAGRTRFSCGGIDRDLDCGDSRKFLGSSMQLLRRTRDQQVERPLPLGSSLRASSRSMLRMFKPGSRKSLSKFPQQFGAGGRARRPGAACPAAAQDLDQTSKTRCDWLHLH
ncbi:MAG UNVERIFIED_CONTAM: hypothetical protein LVR18_25270 [Planctomycetaceae bacterium]